MFIIIQIISAITLGHVVNGYVLNNDPQYSRWVNGKVPFYVKPGDYSRSTFRLLITNETCTALAWKYGLNCIFNASDRHWGDFAEF